MHKLSGIKENAQLVANAIEYAMKVDVTIVDRDRVRIAGTGLHFDLVGKKVHCESIIDKLGGQEIPIFMFDPVSDECKNCTRFDTCSENITIVHPIVIKEVIAGFFGLVCKDQAQYDRLAGESDKLFVFLREMAKLLESQVLLLETLKDLKIEIHEVDEIIGSIDEGVMVIDKDFKVNHVNEKCLEIIGLMEEDLKQKDVRRIVEGLILEGSVHNKTGTWRIGGQEMGVYYSIRHIFVENKRRTSILTFKRISEIINLAHNLLYLHNKMDITFDDIIGMSPNFMESKDIARKASAGDSSILLQGESGTGKEIFARAIHNFSSRKNGPLVTVNCSAIPENLLESELFGYAEGAFTGARKGGKLGKFQLADKGTLFLDEIGDLPLSLQPKLLRVLQGKFVEPIGAKEPVQIDVRILSATHKDLRTLIREGKFREDLFYRLNVIPIKIPPLRERKDLLVYGEYFLSRLSKMRKMEKSFSDEVKRIVEKHPWPGNLRELENVIEYAVSLSADRVIKIQDLPAYLTKGGNLDFAEESIGRPLSEHLEEYEGRIINEYLDYYGHSTEGKKKAAKVLGISLATLYRKILT